MQYQAEPQQQAASAQYVGVGPRFLAVLIDGIIVGIVGGILSLGLRNQPQLLGILDTVLYLLYFIVLEGAMGGKTLGKMVMGLRVVREDGAPISWQESLIRNLMRIIDTLPFAYILGAIIIWTSPIKQRLGDKLAHTVVVRSR